MSRRPAFQFYPADWRTDAGLRLCSVGARGLWIEMMSIMHDGEPYGHLTIQGRPIAVDMLARLVGEGASAIKRLLAELEVNEVFSRTVAGVIFSRRMVRDEDLRERRAQAGQAGAEHGHKGGSFGKMGGRPPKDKNPPRDSFEGGFGTGLEPPPSSSSSSSSAEVSSEANASAVPASNVTAVDFTKSIFDTGTTILTASGKTDREARSILGRWRKTYSDSAVLTCLARCQVVRPEEPLEWVTKALQAEQRNATGATNGSSIPTRESTRQTGERLAARLAG